MHFRAQLVLRVDGKLKQSKKLYDLTIESGAVSFKESSLFRRVFPKPDKAIMGKRILRVQQGSRYFICRFPDRTNLEAFVAKLREIQVNVIDYFDLTEQDSRKKSHLDYCTAFMSSASFEEDTKIVQNSINRIVFDHSRK
ncbi:hypothetical protein LEN26_020112 [Aphanomyces euteiches]|nr:hypothetical protein LEN26_020112 [Aphanomyces euteiches]KAH9128937.1 hypothetical protein AeMF1_000984 [Aphanomyces euteiches]KAH9131487.1 hypothetical protein AeNC1_019588 [Aphanomyces euteiches]